VIDADQAKTGHPLSIVPNEENIEQLELLIQTIIDHGSQVLLIQLPYFKPFTDVDPSKVSTSQVISEIADRQAVRFVDFNTSEYEYLTQDNDIFYSRLYLNES